MAAESPLAGRPRVPIVCFHGWGLTPRDTFALQAERRVHCLPGAQDHGPAVWRAGAEHVPLGREGGRARRRWRGCCRPHMAPHGQPAHGLVASSRRACPGLAWPPPPQMYQMLASMGWLELQNTVKMDLGEANPYTALVPDLSGAPCCLPPHTRAPPCLPPTWPTDVPVPGQPGLAEAEEHGAQAVQPRAPLHGTGAGSVRSVAAAYKCIPLPQATLARLGLTAVCCPSWPLSPLTAGGVDPDDAFSSIPCECSLPLQLH